MNNVGVGKTMKNVRKPRYIKLVITEAKRNYLVSKLSCDKVSIGKGSSNRSEKKHGYLRNKFVYFGVSVLEISKIVMYEFWYDYVKLKYTQKVK